MAAESEEQKSAKDESEKCEQMFGPVIFSYTRAEALRDEVLMDVSEMAKEAGFKIPTAVTSAVWGEIITPSEKAKEELGQSENGRLWDLLWMLLIAIRRGDGDTDTVHFQMIVADMDDNREVTLKAVIGPGDTSEPVMTIMLPHED